MRFVRLEMRKKMLERLDNLSDLEPGSEKFLTEAKGIRELGECDNKIKQIDLTNALATALPVGATGMWFMIWLKNEDIALNPFIKLMQGVKGLSRR